MGAVRDNNYFVVHGWMINRLELKGIDLRLYAIIYGFSQQDGQKYHGNLQYLIDWTNSSKSTVLRSLQTLVEKGLLIKTDFITNGVKTCEYHCNLDFPRYQNDTGGGIKMTPGRCQNDTGGGIKMTPNNISDKDIDNKKDKKGAAAPGPLPASEKKTTKKAKIDTEAILQRYTQDAKALELLREWLKVRKAKRAPETEKALTLNLDKLHKLAHESGLSVPAYLEAVIARGWAAFYPIRESGQAPRPPRSRVRTEEEHSAGQHASGFGWG